MPLVPLAANSVHLWITLPDKVNSSLLPEYEQLITDSEREKVGRLYYAEDRRNALIARALVRTALSHYADRPPQHWCFSKGAHGKPEIIDPPAGLRFNLSHTQGMIVCAVSRHHDLGVDVENCQRRNDLLKIARHYFSAAECEALFSLPSAQQKDRFFDYWTLKESYIKACGEGLAIALDSFSFQLPPPATTGNGNNAIPVERKIKLAFAPTRNDDPEQWQHWLLHYPHSHRLALSLRGAGTSGHSVELFQYTPLAETTPLAVVENPHP
jgi:4'-phosphopantetheinyl transferase